MNATTMSTAGLLPGAIAEMLLRVDFNVQIVAEHCDQLIDKFGCHRSPW
jgi:hypothetical protein